MGADNDDPGLMTALVEELMKKTSMSWLRLPPSEREHVVWHIWHQGAAYIVSGGSEQPVPGIESADFATVIARTKDSRQRMAAWIGRVSTVRPHDREWDEIVGALISSRLNLTDVDHTVRRWQQECVITRLTPTGMFDERPGTMPDDDLAAAPVPTTATTRRGLPRVLHRRQTRRPDLR